MIIFGSSFRYVIEYIIPLQSPKTISCPLSFLVFLESKRIQFFVIPTTVTNDCFATSNKFADSFI